MCDSDQERDLSDRHVNLPSTLSSADLDQISRGHSLDYRKEENMIDVGQQGGKTRIQ